MRKAGETARWQTAARGFDKCKLTFDIEADDRKFSASGVAAAAEHVGRLRILLAALDAAERIEDLDGGLSLNEGLQRMAMKTPPHPGELIRDNIADLGLSVAEGAAGLGVTRQQLYNVINGRSGITPEMAIRLEKAFGGSADVWLRMQGNYDLAQIRGSGKEIVVTRLVPRVG